MRAFIALLSRFPVMLEAFESLPEWDRNALLDGLRECVVSSDEEAWLVFRAVVGDCPEEGGGRMKERPILFDGRMVRAILDGRKRQTRRMVRWPKPPEWHDGDLPAWQLRMRGGVLWPLACFSDGCGRVVEYDLPCPFGVPGDRLWVREAFFHVAPYKRWPLFAAVDSDFIYRADYDYREDRGKSVIGCHTWKPSIHMPRSASRIELEIKDVRVEQLKAISERDAVAEGAQKNVLPSMEFSWTPEMGFIRDCVHYPVPCECEPHETARDWFRVLWESLYAPDAWEENPCVWVVDFSPIQPNA